MQCRLSDARRFGTRGSITPRRDRIRSQQEFPKSSIFDEVAPPPDRHCAALRVQRTTGYQDWAAFSIGRASPFRNTAACCTRLVFLAMNGITGPLEVFEGDKGFMDAIAGVFDIDWLREDLERVKRTILKRFNAEIHSQTTIQAVLDLKARHQFCAADVQRIDIETFDVAFNIIGGGEEGDKTNSVTSKEQADHSLPYVVAVAVLDGDVMPAQYESGRILREDVQNLLRRVSVTANPAYSQRFPDEMPCQVRVTLSDGRTWQGGPRLPRVCEAPHVVGISYPKVQPAGSTVHNRHREKSDYERCRRHG